VQLANIFPFETVSDPASPQAAANGQYLLISRSVYNEIGGFGAVRDDILDDVALACLLKRRGGRLLFLPGAEWVRTRMYTSFRSMWQGWSKNLYLLYGRKPGAVLKALCPALLLDVLFPLGLLAMGIWIVAGESTLWPLLGVVMCYLGATLRQWSYRQRLEQLGFERRLATYHFAGAVLFSLLLVNSMWAHTVAGGVRWKGRSYHA
jgi:hypothetical protein